MHKDKHKFLTTQEVNLLKSHFKGDLVNEGFVQATSSFEEFIKTKNIACVVANNQRVEILTTYLD